MRGLKWWFIIVGAFYVFLGLMGLYGVFFYPALLGENFPFPVDSNGVRAAGDMWLVFALEILVFGGFLIWASRNPLKNVVLVWLVVWLEVIRGIVDDLYLISQGYDAFGYWVFIVIHLAVIITGILFARRAKAEAERAAA